MLVQIEHGHESVAVQAGQLDLLVNVFDVHSQVQGLQVGLTIFVGTLHRKAVHGRDVLYQIELRGKSALAVFGGFAEEIFYLLAHFENFEIFFSLKENFREFLEFFFFDLKNLHF